VIFDIYELLDRYLAWERPGTREEHPVACPLPRSGRRAALAAYHPAAGGGHRAAERTSLPARDPGTRAGRRREVAKPLRWLSTFPGQTWQQRWLASGAEEHPGAAWAYLPLEWLRRCRQLASYDPTDLSAGLLMLICGDVIRPGLDWMLTRTKPYLAATMAQTRDPEGFAQLRSRAEAEPASSGQDARIAETRIATLLAYKGGTISEASSIWAAAG
jgi:hypothetical protein